MLQYLSKKYSVASSPMKAAEQYFPVVKVYHVVQGASSFCVCG